MRHHQKEAYKKASEQVEDNNDVPDFVQNLEPDLAEKVEEEKEDLKEAESQKVEAKEELSAEEKLNNAIQELRLRSAAEMENFKKRLLREHQEQLRYAAEKVLGDLLPTLDNLDLALQFGSKDEACKGMLDGVAMTKKLLLDAVNKHGLVVVGVEGEEFSPQIHEAVGSESRDDLEKNTVSRVLQAGYKLGDRLLRPARVMVNQ